MLYFSYRKHKIKKREALQKTFNIFLKLSIKVVKNDINMFLPNFSTFKSKILGENTKKVLFMEEYFKFIYKQKELFVLKKEES